MVLPVSASSCVAAGGCGFVGVVGFADFGSVNQAGSAVAEVVAVAASLRGEGCSYADKEKEHTIRGVG